MLMVLKLLLKTAISLFYRSILRLVKDRWSNRSLRQLLSLPLRTFFYFLNADVSVVPPIRLYPLYMQTIHFPSHFLPALSLPRFPQKSSAHLITFSTAFFTLPPRSSSVCSSSLSSFRSSTKQPSSDPSKKSDILEIKPSSFNSTPQQ